MFLFLTYNAPTPLGPNILCPLIVNKSTPKYSKFSFTLPKAWTPSLWKIALGQYLFLRSQILFKSFIAPVSLLTKIKDINKKVKEITETRDKLDGVSKNYRITAKDVKFKDIVIIRRNQRKKKIADMANDYITCLISNYEINCNQIIYMGEQVATEIKAKFNNNWTNLENIS